MVGLPPGERSGRATCVGTAMLHPGSASCRLPTDPCEVVLSGSAKSPLSAHNVALLCFVMDFIYVTTMQVYLIFFVFAAVAVLADHSSNAVLEDPVASKAVMLGSDHSSKRSVTGQRTFFLSKHVCLWACAVESHLGIFFVSHIVNPLGSRSVV